MSSESDELSDFRAALAHPATAATLRIARLVARGALFFAFAFAEIVAELLAPVALIAGLGWAMVPRVLALMGGEGQTHDMLRGLAEAVPHEIQLGSLTLTPTTLIVDGLLLVALIALSRTLQTIVATET